VSWEEEEEEQQQQEEEESKCRSCACSLYLPCLVRDKVQQLGVLGDQARQDGRQLVVVRLQV